MKQTQLCYPAPTEPPPPQTASFKTPSAALPDAAPRIHMLHARAMAQAVQASDGSPSARAYGVLAQVLLMQHSCHWFCKSRAVASARLLARHQSSHLKVLESVDPATRAAYEGLIGGA